MDMKSLAQDLAVLRTASERFSRNIQENCAVWPTKGGTLAAGTQEAILLMAPENEAVKLTGPVNLERLYGAVRGLETGHLVPRENGIAVIGGGATEEIEHLKDSTGHKLPAGAPFEDRSTVLNLHEPALDFVRQAASQEAVRFALCGVFFDSKNQAIVASDGKRLHWRPFKSEKQFPNVLVPNKSVDILIAAMRREEMPIKRLRLSSENKETPGWASILIHRALLYTRLIDGHFPDWKAVMPGMSALSLYLDAQRYRSILKDLTSFVRNKKASGCYFKPTASQNGLELVGFHEQGTRRHQLQVDDVRGDIRAIHYMALQPEYLLDASWNDQQTILQVESQDKALCVDGCAIVMPLSGVGPAAGYQSEAKRITASLPHNIIRAKADATSTWRRKSIAKIKDPLAEQLAPKAITPASTRRPAAPPPVSSKPRSAPAAAPAQPDPVGDQRKRSLKTQESTKDKQYDFLLFS